jgi:hypothetical protein
MTIEIMNKPTFFVMGKEGSTDMKEGFIQKLWAEANTHFSEVSALAKKLSDESLAGCWGVMSNMSMTFDPWEDDYSKGRYLAGVECEDDAVPPQGWTKWKIPGFEMVKISCDVKNTFLWGLSYIKEHGYTLVGAVQDFTDLNTGKNYMCFPIKRL